MSGLRKAKKYDWKDSNLALFGSDEDKKVKKESAEHERAWKGAGEKPGLQIWRIVKFKVQHWPKEDYGRFYRGDSYIILHTYKPDPSSDKLAWDVHFWIGQESTQDEYGTAAYKTVELDTYLDDGPVQHREVQGHESEKFKSYFKKIEILKGGADTGFRHVEPKEYKPRLLHFHGGKGKGITVTEVPLNKDHLDPTDVFVLDHGLAVFVWQGPEANKDEKFKAVQYVQQMKSERSVGQVEIVDETDTDSEFYKTLNDERYHEDDDDEDDEDDSETFSKTLVRLSDATGDLDFTEVKKDNVTLDDFDANDVFIYDTGKNLFTWVGNGASTGERQNAMSYAHKYLMGTQHPLISITCIKQGMETPDFLAAMSA